MRSASTMIAVATLAGGLEARTITVDDDLAQRPDAEFQSVQAALDAAADGDEIIIYPGAYGMGAILFLRDTPNVTLRSSDPADPAVVAATLLRPLGRDLVLISERNPGLLIDGLTFTGAGQGSRPGGGIQSDHDITIRRCAFEFLEERSFAAINPRAGDVVVEDSVFRNNRNRDGLAGAIELMPDRGPASLTVRRSIFDTNGTNGNGGAIRVIGNVNITIEGGEFVGNFAGASGGAIFADSGLTPTARAELPEWTMIAEPPEVLRTLFRGNRSSQDGMGVAGRGYTLDWRNSSFFDHRGDARFDQVFQEGTVSLTRCVGTMRGCDWERNHTMGGSSALRLESSDVLVEGSSIVNNNAGKAGDTFAGPRSGVIRQIGGACTYNRMRILANRFDPTGVGSGVDGGPHQVVLSNARAIMANTHLLGGSGLKNDAQWIRLQNGSELGFVNNTVQSLWRGPAHFAALVGGSTNEPGNSLELNNNNIMLFTDQSAGQPTDQQLADSVVVDLPFDGPPGQTPPVAIMPCSSERNLIRFLDEASNDLVSSIEPRIISTADCGDFEIPPLSGVASYVSLSPRDFFLGIPGASGGGYGDDPSTDTINEFDNDELGDPSPVGSSSLVDAGDNLRYSTVNNGLNTPPFDDGVDLFGGTRIVDGDLFQRSLTIDIGAVEFQGPTGCSPADLVPPFGVISQADVAAFVDLFFAGDPFVAGLAAPFDVVSQADVAVFVNLFFAGCPAR